MKRVLLLLLLCWASSAVAQNAGIVSGSQLSAVKVKNSRSVFTVEAGADILWMNPSDDFYKWGASVDGTGVGFHIRGLYKLRLAEELPFYAHAGLGFAYNRSGKIIENPGPEESEIFTGQYLLWYLQIPVGVEYRFELADRFALSPYLGLNFNIGLDGKYHHESKLIESGSMTNQGDIDHMFDKGTGELRRFRPDLAFGVNAEWRRFIFGVGVQVGLNNMIQKELVELYESENAGSPKLTYTGLTISVGYRF